MIDEITKKNIADALWLDRYDPKKIPARLRGTINSKKNSNAEQGKRLRSYFRWLIDNQQSHNPNYIKRYRALIDNMREVSAQQAYIISSSFVGNNYTQGYAQLPESAEIEFPFDHQPQFKNKVGWHFFVGSAWDENGQEYGIELMFFRVAILPPLLAAELGLSDIENQTIEIQIGISKAGDKHHQADPIVISGTTGLIQFNSEPFTYSIGKNYIKSLKNNSFLPMQIVAKGKDRGDDFELGLDLTFTTGKEYLLQGEKGNSPNIAGMGTLYYSIPNLVLKSGSKINYGGKNITLKKGVFWFDHQWGFLGGNPNSKVLRAANNINKPNPAGWDWFMAQFNGNRQITMSALHSNKYIKYYYQSGKTPPPNMKVPVTAKFFEKDKSMRTCQGVMVVDGWIKSKQSPNPKLYQVSNCWYPNHWSFSFDDTVPKDIREFTMSQIVPSAQTNFFANGAQYNEGAVYIKNSRGKTIGRGFAESVQYSDIRPIVYKLLGYSKNVDLQKLLEKNQDTYFGKLKSFLYVMTHQKDLKSIISRAKGLEMLGPIPKGK